MTLQLEPLKTSHLTNMEAGQLIKRHLSDLMTIDPALPPDAPFTAYVQYLTSQSALYQKGLMQLLANEETVKIARADQDRDLAVNAFGKALKLYALSDDPAEVEASRSLGLFFGLFKNLATLNYEAESNAIDKLVSDLQNPAYQDEVNLLQLNRYVTRLQTTNDNFKSIFGNRMTTTAMTEIYDLKLIRKEMFAKYSEFASYVLAMAKATNTPRFLTALNLLNTARKYYDDMLTRRIALNAEPEKPSLN